MAHIRVEYSEVVDVYIDRKQSGKTGESLRIVAGGHDIAIGDADSSICPPIQRVDVEEAGNTIATPLVVRFSQA